MKKLYYFLLLALPVLFLASCHDDDDLPDVDVSMRISGAVNIDGTLYAVQGDTLSVDSIGIVNREQGKAAIITSASYYIDYQYQGTSVTPPYGASFKTEDMAVGPHLLQVECPLFAVDKTPANIYFSYKVVVVADADEIPTGQQQTQFIVRPGVRES